MIDSCALIRRGRCIQHDYAYFAFLVRGWESWKAELCAFFLSTTQCELLCHFVTLTHICTMTFSSLHTRRITYFHSKLQIIWLPDQFLMKGEHNHILFSEYLQNYQLLEYIRDCIFTWSVLSSFHFSMLTVIVQFLCYLILLFATRLFVDFWVLWVLRSNGKHIKRTNANEECCCCG
jgi:hypothetical protein